MQEKARNDVRAGYTKMLGGGSYYRALHWRLSQIFVEKTCHCSAMFEYQSVFLHHLGPLLLINMQYIPDLPYIYSSKCMDTGPSQVGGWGNVSPPVFGQTVNPISTRGADYAHHSTTSPPKFSDLATALLSSNYFQRQ